MMQLKKIITRYKNHSIPGILLLILLVFTSFQQSIGKPGVRDFIARDDGALNASFAAFRKDLLESIVKHDKAAIEQVVSSNIDTTIGGARGVDAFEKRWQGLDHESSFWSMARKILEHGAQFDRESNEFHAPAVSFEDNHSDFPQGIIWSKDALLYSRPILSAPSKKGGYNNQLTIIEPKEHQPISVKWLKVRTRQGGIGYMKAEDVYSSFDDFAVFKKENDKWRLSWFGYAEL
jgi:hypothetical protein